MELRRATLCPWKPVGIDALSFGVGKFAQTLAVGRENGAMELWDTRTWQLRCSSPGKHGRSLVSVLWISGTEESCERLISAGLHREIIEWDVNTLEPIETAVSGGGAIWSLALSKDQLSLYAACDDGTVRILSLQGGLGTLMYKDSIQVEKSRLLSVTMGSDCDTIFVGGSESRISKWSVKSKSCTGSMMLEKAGPKDQHTLIWRLVNLEDEMLASGDSIGLVYIWDIVACVVLQKFAQHQGDVTALCSNGELLISGGIDAKIAHYTRQRGSRERWLHSDVTFCHSHDIRAIAIDSCQGSKQNPTYVSGGVAGNLFVQVREAGRLKRPMECSAFSPLMHQVAFAQSSRFMLTQQDRRLQLWYMKEPETRLLDGELMEPEVQQVISIILSRKMKSQDGSKETLHHLTCSALAPDGKMLAASEMTGTRLFEVNVEQLQVRRISALPNEMASCPMRAMCFAGRGLLVMATWHEHRILVLDCKDKSIVATFEEHQAPVTHLHPGGADHAEWLLSGDVAGGVKVFDLDALRLHCSVPVGEEMATALSFDGSGGKVLVVNAMHQLNVFDIESQALEHQLRIPPRYLPMHGRVCGVFSVTPGKLVMWGHGFLLAVNLEASGSSSRWRTWPNRFLLGLASVFGPWLNPETSKGSRMPTAIAVEVSEKEVKRLLPEPFERKSFGFKRKWPF